MINKLMLVSEYRNERFSGNKKPSTRTIKRWIEGNYIPGKKIGGLYYVDVTAELSQTGDPELDALMEKFG